MAVDTRLLDRLEQKLGVSRRQINRMITERARTLVLPREQAAVALALESKVNVTTLATAEDLAAIRGAAAAKAPEPAAQAVISATQRQPKKREATKKIATRKRRAPKKNSRKVFVVHGRDDEKRRDMFAFLRAIGLEPIEWSKAVKATKKASPYIAEVLDRAFKDAAAVIVMLTPDDQARLRRPLRKAKEPLHETRLTGQARANVLFEAGMAFGRHEDSTVLVEIGDLRPFSDIGGRHTVRLDDHAETRQDLANRLQAAGCEVDLEGTDWLKEGTFG